MFVHILRPLRTNCVFNGGRMIMKFDMRGCSSFLSGFPVQNSMSHRWKLLEKEKNVASRECWKLLGTEKDKIVASRVCWKLLQAEKSVAQRACWKLLEKVKSLASRACWKLLKKRAQHQERIGSYLRKKRSLHQEFFGSQLRKVRCSMKGMLEVNPFPPITTPPNNKN